MNISSDTQVLRQQYGDAANLNARIALHTRFSSNPTPWHRWVFDRLQLPATATVLEIGCGPGYLWSRNADRVPSGWFVHLSDSSPGMVGEARKALHAAGFRFLVADAHALPFKDGRFDCVIANHMLYHVADRGRALREIARLLKQDGCLIAATVGDTHMVELDTLLRDSGAGVDVGASMAAPFTLQNGGGQLAVVFGHVELQRYPSTLRVTDAEPVVAYAQSIPGGREFRAGTIDYIRSTVARQIAERGEFTIGTDTGVFAARRHAAGSG